MGSYPARKIRGQKGEQFDYVRGPEGMSDRLWQAKEHLDVARGTHGTTMFDTPTRHILPATAHGNVVFPGLSDQSRAYYTALRQPDQMMPGSDARSAAEVSGWHWAGYAQRAAVEREGAEVLPRSVVHEVTPEGRVDLDHNLNKEGTSTELTADRLRITKTHWTPPPEAFGGGYGVAGVQGTFPRVNWNQFGPPPSSYEDRNYAIVYHARGQKHEEPQAEHREDPRQGRLF